MKRLRTQGIDRLVMLTGDNASMARRVAAKTGITDIRAESLPGQKLTVVRELEKDRGVIALLLIASESGIIPLSVAVVLHEGSTIVVFLNSLRLLAWHEENLK